MKELSSVPFQAEEGSVPGCPLPVPGLCGGGNGKLWGLPVLTLLRKRGSALAEGI